MKINYDDSSDEKVLAYDLRQLDAQLTGEIKRDIAVAKKEKQYYAWFRNILDLWDQVSHYLKNYDSVIVLYEKELKKVRTILNKYEPELTGDSKDQQNIEIIEETLRKFEQFIYKKMYDSGMFGLKYEDDGL